MSINPLKSFISTKALRKDSQNSQLIKLTFNSSIIVAKMSQNQPVLNPQFTNLCQKQGLQTDFPRMLRAYFTHHQSNLPIIVKSKLFPTVCKNASFKLLITLSILSLDRPKFTKEQKKKCANIRPFLLGQTFVKKTLSLTPTKLFLTISFHLLAQIRILLCN